MQTVSMIWKGTWNGRVVTAIQSVFSYTTRPKVLDCDEASLVVLSDDLYWKIKTSVFYHWIVDDEETTWLENSSILPQKIRNVCTLLLMPICPDILGSSEKFIAEINSLDVKVQTKDYYF